MRLLNKNHQKLLMAGVLSIPLSANASLEEFFGEDISAGGVFVPSGEAETARNNFKSKLSEDAGVVDFESIPVGVASFLNLNFGDITALLTRGIRSISVRNAPLANNFNTTPGGSRYLFSQTDRITIHFDTPISAFGFYATDIGDVGGIMTLVAENGVETELSVPHTVVRNGSTNGSLLFYGFVDDEVSYSSISIRNSSRGSDIFGYDDIVAADITKVIMPVAIDVKPGDEPNCFNSNGRGVIPVAILGSESIDAYNIDASSLSFGGLEVKTKGNQEPQCSINDVNDDGYMDMICQFEDDASFVESEEGYATLDGTLLDSGRPIVGTDSICLVPSTSK